ncbi:hypothetical protein FLAV_02083 [Flavobacteriales bacterium]|nr:hypothetical protein [Flavobacteriales bacterium]MCL4817050.1 DUF302 domain-containing protein [Flavobacteriales bacterium]WKZ76087.1 MAG: DUF302 domain-containing protein [Vicingaceae bacterium]GIK70523.1 MAG: hypothetical protein BroJett020_18180 [Bacteroidota bacterium]CAG0986809.1 hypothetical protein FLAV_02083 [Flavobacteriales bacterium]
MKYYSAKTIKATTIEAIRPKVEEELKKEGFGVLTEIDIQATMKKKLNKDYLPHVILGACNPVYADKVLSLEPTISTMLPCNVTLRQLQNGDLEIAIIDPFAAMGAVGNSALEVHAKEVNDKLIRVLANI